MGNAKAEINSLNEKGLYDYLVINDNVEEVRETRVGDSSRDEAGLDDEDSMGSL